MTELLIKVLETEAVQSLIVAAVAYAIAKIFAWKPGWEKHRGLITQAIKVAEKEIPDNTENAGLLRADKALKIIIEALGYQPNDKQLAELNEGVSVIHAELEANGNLSKAEK